MMEPPQSSNLSVGFSGLHNNNNNKKKFIIIIIFFIGSGLHNLVIQTNNVRSPSAMEPPQSSKQEPFIWSTDFVGSSTVLHVCDLSLHILTCSYFKSIRKIIKERREKKQKHHLLCLDTALIQQRYTIDMAGTQILHKK